jgi:hypothetical protein
MLNDGAIGVMLDALAADVTHLAVHDDYPGTAFDNEKTDGSPATTRESAAWDAWSSGRTVTQDGTATFDVTGAVRWITGASALSGGNQRSVWPCDGAPREYTVDPSTDVFEVIAHGFTDEDTIVFYGTSVPGGVTIGQIYFVRDATTDTFKIEASVGGGAVDIDARPSTPGALVSPITEYTGGQRPFAVSGLILSGAF